MPKGTDWCDADVIRLRVLWDLVGPDFTVADISQQMGRSRNSIIGKAHRLHLPAKPSPIIRRDPQAPPRIYRPRSTLPKLASVPMIVRLEPHQAASLGKRPPKPPAPIVNKEPERTPDDRVVVPSPYKTCQWITSDRRPWVFCGDATDPGHGTYCTKHARASRGSWRAANLADAA